MNLSDEDRAKRLFTVKNAIATQRLEGLDVGAETVADLEAWANGEMTLDEAKARCLVRIKQRVEGAKG
ncbi:antitoxin VbhA family protein [Paraburkholderia strydomiana]|uniref:antitoxin VbhA family protein n=1 Tax=Paraburkholderia strydomiana TaxID=1245417 RepID=UPI0038B92E2A